MSKPDKIFSEIPKEILDIILEKENPPGLSFLQKNYYYLRPYIPLKLRHILQSKRKIKYEKNWYITEKIIILYKAIFGENDFFDSLVNLWGIGVTSPLVLTHDVETSEGLFYVPKVLELEEKYGFRSSWNIVPYLYKIPEEIVDLILQKDCEIGIHGYNHDGRDFFSNKIFNKRAEKINLAIDKYGARGYRSPATHRNLEWMQVLNIEYDSSCFDIDPFQPMPGGTHYIWPFKAGKFIELPYTMPQDHVLWIQLGEKNIDIWKKKTEWLLKYKGMILLITHPDYLMIGDNIKLYEEFLAFVKSIKGIVNILPGHVVNYWKENILKNNLKKTIEF